MKFKIVLVLFPFDDLSSVKVRPALCLTDVIGSHDQIVLAFITSRSALEPSNTDLNILMSDPNFVSTGLKVDSTIRFHRLLTISARMVKRELGHLPETLHGAVKDRLRKLFDI